ncbi:hypothetical protein ASZ90_016081 [hydrocarbon metagenome]|uniref:Uncharacterized protein n=1 Tax=hydrocarbon metagenome TaxID=938273 RepID=A0A0W8F057_9ZZZZ
MFVRRMRYPFIQRGSTTLRKVRESVRFIRGGRPGEGGEDIP